jgi:hypothetical protein
MIFQCKFRYAFFTSCNVAEEESNLPLEICWRRSCCDSSSRRLPSPLVMEYHELLTRKSSSPNNGKDLGSLGLTSWVRTQSKQPSIGKLFKGLPALLQDDSIQLAEFSCPVMLLVSVALVPNEDQKHIVKLLHSLLR